MAEPIKPITPTQRPWHMSRAEERMKQEQLAALHASTTGEISQAEATARVKLARARYLRHKANWHIHRAGTGGSRLLAEEYIRQAEQNEKEAQDVRQKSQG